jgi:hypothetical protein
MLPQSGNPATEVQVDTSDPDLADLPRPPDILPASVAVKRLFFGALAIATLAPFALILGLRPHVGQLPGLSQLIGLTGVGHVAATLFLYGDGKFRPLVRRNWVPFIAAPLGFAVIFGLIAHWLPAIWGGVLPAYTCWLLYHYQRQSYGIVAFACKAANLRAPTELSRALDLTVVAGMLGLVATGTVGLPVLVSAHVTRLVAGTIYVGALAWAAIIVRRNADVQRSPLVLTAAAAAALFLLPALLPGDALVVFWTYAIAHGAQYLIFMTVLAWNAPRGPSTIIGLLAALAGAGGLFALIGLPGGVPVYLGLVCGHFLIDAKVWRLREMPQKALIGRRFASALNSAGAATTARAAA